MSSAKHSIAIIGIAGSRDNMINFSKIRFEAMVKETEDAIINTGLDWNEIELWSGGSSGADHIAVVLALKYNCNIKLFLPCEFNDGRFFDNGKYNYKQNTGKQLNILHNKFGRKVNLDTLSQIKELLNSENSSVSNGFFERNKKIAIADAMIALTASVAVKDGGTQYTWGRSTSEYKLHIDIRSLPY